MRNRLPQVCMALLLFLPPRVFAAPRPVAGMARPIAAVAELLPADYRGKTIPAEKPLVLHFRFAGDAGDLNAISLHVVNYPGKKSDLFYYHMHVPERTSLAMGLELVKQNGGTVISLRHPGGRDMRIRIGDVIYQLDPNRIFTEEALASRTSPPPSPAHLAQLREFVAWTKENILRGLGQRAVRLVTALHNNTDDDTEGKLLSILTEKELLGRDNRQVNQNPTWDVDNFFIVTLKSTYDLLVRRWNSNVALRLEKPRNIGYLSNWMINAGINYVNIEAQHGDAAGARLMIQQVQEAFP